MDSETLAGIAAQYPWANWAVWDNAFPDGDCVEKRPERLVEFVHDQAEVLTPDIVHAALASVEFACLPNFLYLLVGDLTAAVASPFLRRLLHGLKIKFVYLFLILRHISDFFACTG